MGARQSFICADAEQLPLSAQSVDLIFSNLAMQWCDIEAVFAECQRILKPGGLFLFSTFGPDTLVELRQSWKQVDTQQHVNTFIDMHDIGDALIRQGFSDPVIDMEMFTLTYSTVKALLQDLKAIGANAVVGDNKVAGLLGKKKWQALLDAYEQYRQGQVLPASYEVLFGHAWGMEKTVVNTGNKEVYIAAEQVKKLTSSPS